MSDYFYDTLEPTPEPYPEEVTIGFAVHSLIVNLTTAVEPMLSAIKRAQAVFDTGEPKMPNLYQLFSVELPAPIKIELGPDGRPDLGKLRAKRNHGPRTPDFQHRGR